MANGDFTFTTTLTNVSKEAREALKKMCTELQEYTIYADANDSPIPVATIKKHEDCPQELFEKVIKQMING